MTDLDNEFLDQKYICQLSSEEEKAVDDALGLQVVSLRLQKELVDTFKELATREGTGYQSLMRLALERYISGCMR